MFSSPPFSSSALPSLRQGLVQAFILGLSVLYVAKLLQRSRDRHRENTLEAEPGPRELDLARSDSGIVNKYSSHKTIQTRIARYPCVRVFWKDHAQANNLPIDPPLPILVFIHGLGGSVSQFHLLLSSLANVGPCLGIDLPGCGLSRFEPKRWDAYHYDALVDVWIKVIGDYCDGRDEQQIILIGHSLGCLFAQSIAARSKAGKCKFNVSGLVAICPPCLPRPVLTTPRRLLMAALLSLPDAIMDAWRQWDKRGGIHSASVTRFVGDAADVQTRELQLKYNNQSQTPVFKRFLWGIITGTAPAAEDWAKLPASVKVLLIGAEDDPVTPVKNLDQIRNAIRANEPAKDAQSKILPGSHALHFDHNNYRSVAGIIETFLTSLDERLSLGWQLHYLATDGKWDVKNVLKWQSIDTISNAIGHPVPLFRAMKTMREIDDEHSPKQFTEKWRGKIVAVVDISHDTPVYDPKTLQEGGIDYHKFPTVSKYPPSEHEVQGFVALVDKIRTKAKLDDETEGNQNIAVHCHYGFNRTGFFIASYLVLREGYSVQQAIDEFQEKRSPGIKHPHFLDTMFMRYGNKKREASRGA